MKQEQIEEISPAATGSPVKTRKGAPVFFLKPALVLCVAALVVMAGYFLMPKNFGVKPAAEFSEVWRLVPEKVSLSAGIRVYTPAGMTADQVAQNAKFEPEIAGRWLGTPTSFFDLIGVAYGQDGGANAEYAVYQPDEPLSEGLHYGITLALADGNLMNADFLAVGDPRIEGIFPAGNMEAPEDSKITIVFSRPMAALSVVDMMEPKDLPIKIVPETKGQWKWISTNTLQFIPSETLKLSSNYTIKIGSGLTSLEGLAVEPAEASFRTRNLRYLKYDAIGDDVVYNQPYRIYFNQPVDLDKTAAQIRVTEIGSNEAVDFVVEYKKVEKTDEGLSRADGSFFSRGARAAKKYFYQFRASILGSLGGAGGEDDKTVIEIYGKKDKFGRSKFWDTDKSYQVILDKAYPAEGDIIIDALRQAAFKTTGLTDGFFEEGGRSDYADANMFDPQGKLGIRFYESIDLNASKFGASVPVVKKEFGKKCTDPYLEPDDFNCDLIDDTRAVLLTFDKSGIRAGDIVTVALEKVVNEGGDRINGETIKRDIYIYKPLEYRMAKRGDKVDLDSLTLCSNNPLEVPANEDLKKKIDARREFEIFSWNGSRKRSYEEGSMPTSCNPGEFETVIGVGLIPSTDYGFNFNVTDLFGQTLVLELAASTGPMEGSYVALFPMQQEVSVTTPDKTILTYGSENITYADVSVCKLSAYDFWRQQERLSDWGAVNAYPANCIQKVDKRIELPERYWLTNYFDIDIARGFDQPLGNYIVTLANPLYTDYDGGRRYRHSYITVTGLSAAQKSLNLSDYLYSGATALTSDQLEGMKNIYWVSDIKTLAPVAGARVVLYSGNVIAGESITDSQGVAMIKPVAGADLAIVEFGNDSTIVAGYDTKMNWASTAYNVRRAYIYTDRPIYRPGDKVNIKGILRLGYDGNYQMWENDDVAIEIRGPQWDIVATPTAVANRFGTFTVDYLLDSEAALGNYEVCVKGGGECGSFSVKEYSPAAFKVAASTGEEEYISGDKIKVNVDAQYYFGVPVANANVEYTISSQNYYFDKYAEGGYSFGYFEDCGGSYCYGDKFIRRGVLKLDEDGKGTIGETIDLQKIAGEAEYANSRIIVFDITATNSLGQSISAQKSLIVHAGEVYLGAKADPFFTAKGQAVNIEAQAVDPEGAKSSAGGVAAAVYRVEWIYAKRLEAGGHYNYDWSKKREKVADIGLDSKGGGSYAGNTTFDKEGQYEIDITGRDGRGNTVMSRDYVYVYGNGIASIRRYDDNQLTLRAEKEKLDAGEQGSLIIESPFPQAKALVTIERGKVFKYEIIDIKGSMHNYKFDAADEYAPNVYVSVLLQSADPAVKFGTQEFKVNSDRHKLNIEVKSDKKTYKPGDKVTLNIHAADNRGEGVSADISVAVVDLSVLALAGNPKKDPLVFFYDGFPLTVNTYSSVKEALIKVDNSSRTKGGSGGGNNGEDNGVRGEFRDTAFWEGSAVTDVQGNARIEFELPDNLTTWQAEALGVTKDTKLGAGYAEFMSKNDLMVVPVKPRFIISGDQFYVAAQVFNQSDKPRKVKISFASETLNFIGNNREITQNIKSQESKTVYFHIMAPLEQTRGVHSFTINADGEGISDAIRQIIAVVPNLTYEAVATANYVTGAAATEVVYLPDNVSKEQGGLTIRSSATLAVFLSEALNYFVAYPYGCTEQVSSRLRAMAVVKAVLDIPNLGDKLNLKTVWVGETEYTIDDLIDAGLNRVYKNQNSDGGFGMWDNRKSDYYITLEAVKMLEELKLSGASINQSSLDRALGYLDTNFTYQTGRMEPDQMVATAMVLLGSGSNEAKYASSARAAVIGLLAAKNRQSVLNDQLSNKSLAQLSIILSRQDFAGALGQVNAVLDNRITIDSRGAFLQANAGNTFVDNYETTIGDTALYLRSLAAARRDTVYTDEVVRWILSSRDKDGAWGSTQNTLAAVMAFTDFLKWKRETESQFTLAAALNGQQIAQKDFNADTILEQSIAEIKASQFKTGANNIVAFNKSGNITKGGFYYDMGLKYYLSGLAAPRDEGFAVSRAFYALADEEGKTALASAKAGDVLRAHIEVTVGRDRRFVAIEDFIPAGMEIVDMEMATEQKSLRFNEPEVKYNLLVPDYTESRDERAFIYTSDLKAGTYEFDYYVRALAKGDYLRLPCVASEFYNPENFGRSSSSYFKIN